MLPIASSWRISIKILFSYFETQEVQCVTSCRDLGWEEQLCLRAPLHVALMAKEAARPRELRVSSKMENNLKIEL